MNDEKTSTEAEQKKPGDLTDSIARMTACLEDVIANAKAALVLSKNMDRDDMKWMTLSKAVFDVHKRSRMGWQGLVDPAVGTGGGRVLHAEVGARLRDGEPAARRGQGRAHAARPEGAKAGAWWSGVEGHRSRTCGIRRANGTVRAWAIQENAGVEVFAKQIFKDGKPEPCWTFAGTVDCEKVIFGGILGGRNKANQIVRFIRNGLLAARLRLKHKRMNRAAREVDSGRPDLTVIDDPGTGRGSRAMSKAVQEIVADLRKADMSGAQVDAGHVADQIELAFTELEDKWRHRVKDAPAVADRIEAAWKRERVEVRMTASTTILKERVPVAVGNAAAMYEALVKIAHYCDDENEMDDPYCADGHILSDMARAALSAPPRQCDVGTPEDQEARYKMTGEVYHTLTLTNALRWAQTPYEAAEGGAE